MTKFIILAAIALIIILTLYFSSARKKETKREEARAYREWGLSDLDEGGVLTIQGVDYMVDQICRYVSGNAEWFEGKLIGDQNEVRWMTWESDEDEEVSLTTEIDFNDTGTTPHLLEQFADEGVGETEYEGEVYRLSEASEATFHETENSSGRTLYYWDFSSDSGKVLGIILWESRAYNAFAGEHVSTRQIEVLRPGAGEDEDSV